MNMLWAQPPRIVALTGAALSRECGFAPFAVADMPPGLGLEDLVTREGFARDPRQVRDFFNLRRRRLLEIKPGAAHDALAVLDMARPREVLVVTGNIDDLHERAGSLAVVHLHGELLKARCGVCGKASERRGDIDEVAECPVCGNVGQLRPDIAWVGEAPRGIDSVYAALASASLCLVIGANPAGEPVAGILAETRRAGARTIEFNPALLPDAESLFDERIAGPLGTTVPEYVKALIAES